MKWLKGTFTKSSMFILSSVKKVLLSFYIQLLETDNFSILCPKEIRSTQDIGNTAHGKQWDIRKDLKRNTGLENKTIPYRNLR